MRIAVSPFLKRRQVRLGIVLCAAILVPLEIGAQALPNLTLTKTADSATVSAGSTIGFTVTASNSSAAGTGTATGVSLSDPLPGGPGLVWSIDSGPVNCSITGPVGSQVLTCSAVDLAAGASESVHFTSPTTFASCGLKANTVTLTSTNAPTLTANASTTIQCTDLTLTKTADNATVSAGSAIGFTVTASNSSAPGTGTATGVVISDALPGGAGVDWSIASGPANCSITGPVGSETLTCSAVDLAAGASESVHVTSPTTFASCGVLSNSAALTATNAPTLIANASTSVLCPNLTLTKLADSLNVSAGSEIGFTVTASNSSAPGTGTATDVVISDPLPAGLDWVLVSGPVNCSITGPVGSEVLTCLVADLAPGASVTAHVTSPTTSANCGTLTNTATLTGANAPELTASANSTILCVTGTPTNTPTPTPTNTPTPTPTSTPTPTTTGAPAPAPAVPTLNLSGMLVFGLLIAAAGLLLLIRRG